jgi:hypothetical protein
MSAPPADGDARLELHADGPSKQGELRWHVVWRNPAGSSFYRLVRFGPHGDTLWTSDGNARPVRVDCCIP